MEDVQAGDIVAVLDDEDAIEYSLARVVSVAEEFKVHYYATQGKNLRTAKFFLGYTEEKDKAEDKKNPKLVWKATSKTKNVVKWTGVVPFEDGIFLETGLRFRGSGSEKRGWQLTSASANALLSDAWSAFSHFRV